MSIRLLTLGVPACRVDDVELPELPAQKARFALLVYLAIGRNASRDEVTGMFWADSDDDRARHALSQSIYELKRLLGDKWVQSQGGRLVVSDDVQVDALEFARLCSDGSFERAVELYRGPFLSGFFLSNCKEFESWVDRQRSQFERAHRRARRESINQMLEAKRTAGALDMARRWVELDPFEDEANHKLIELLAHSGQRSDALREYAGYEKRLREELAIEPLEDTKRLVDALRSEPVSAAPATSVPVPAPTIRPPTATVEGKPPLVIEQPGFIRELSRRRVFRMAVWYAATSFAVVQFVQTMQEAFHLPPWVLTSTAIAAFAGFPLAALLSWHFDLTSDGVRRAAPARILSRRGGALLVGILILGGGLWISGFKRDVWFASGAQLDTALIVVFPFDYSPSVQTRFDEDQLLRDALNRWNGAAIVDLFQTRSAVQRHGSLDRPEDALTVAHDLRAGRYIRGTITAFRDSVGIHAVLYDAVNGGAALTDRTVRVALNLSGADSAFARLADWLLFRTELPFGEAVGIAGTQSLAARRAFVRGQEALNEWALARADSAFAEATHVDPNYAAAYVWRAQLGAWQESDPARWRFLAEHALEDSLRLDARSRAYARAFVDLSHGQFTPACAVLRDLAARQRHDFAAWYSLATCLRADRAVIDDRASPSGKAFRASYHEAVVALKNAFRIHPSALKALRDTAFLPARRLLFTATNIWRPGVGVAPDTGYYISYVQRQGDTLAFVPFLLSSAMQRHSFNNASALAAGVKLERETFRTIAAAWRAAYPDAADAAEAVSIALEMLGDRRALDSLQTARALAGTPEERLRLATYEALLTFKFSFPDDIAGLRRTVRLADSVLNAAERTRVVDASSIASVAILRGRLNLAVRYYSLGDNADAPAKQYERDGKRLLLYAASSVADSAIALQGRLRAIATAADFHTRESIRESWLLRPIILSFPYVDDAAFAFVASTGHHVVQAQAAERAHNAVASRRIILDAGARRQSFVAPEDLTFDVLTPEAAVLTRTGDNAQAAKWLDPSLSSLTLRAPRAFADPVQLDALLHAAALRAEVAAHLSDRSTATRWANALLILWDHPDAELRAVSARMQQLSSVSTQIRRAPGSTQK